MNVTLETKHVEKEKLTWVPMKTVQTEMKQPKAKPTGPWRE